MTNHNDGLFARTDELGNLILPPEVAASYGIRSNSRLFIKKEANALKIPRPASQLNKLYIEVTDQCNLDCRTCVRHSWKEPMGRMSEPVFEKVIEGLSDFSPLPSIFFGGFGEPLLHPKIIDMISRLKALHIPVELITNGTLLTEEISRKLIHAGLDILWVSIDGAKPESYTDVRLGAVLPDVIRNIETFNRTRFAVDIHSTLRLGIAFVAMKRNIADLPPVADLARRLYANYLMVTNVLPYTQEMLGDVLYYNTLNEGYFKYPELEFPVSLRKPGTSEMFCNEYSQPVLSVNLPRIGMNEETRKAYSLLMSSGIILNMGGISSLNANNRCPFIENGAGTINWDGNLSPCLPLMHSYDMYLDKFHRHSERWIVGNLKEKKLHDIWNTPDHLTFRERVQAFDFPPCTLCGGCEMIDNNEKDCFNNGFPTCGGCLWAQGFIQCP
jgi:MoaA/NifB/PqqE/SkfB family radical SAM enzyme